MKLKVLGDNSQLWQWDTGQKLTVESDIANCAVHFSNTPEGYALVVPVKEQNGLRVVEVPNILLQSASMLSAYLVGYAADGSETRVAYRFPVRARPKPEDYVYTETEVLTYKALEERIIALEENGGSSGGTIKTVNGVGPDENGNVKIEGGFGEPGKDGISCTHEWDGTVLTITSASGTSSADLKGEKGNTGEAGYSPVRGTDYWTDADKEEIKSYVDTAILGGAW